MFDADAEVHRLYDSKAGADLIAPFVPEAARNDRVDRKLLAEAVLKDPALLSQLEKEVHAEIRHRRRRFLQHASATGTPAVVLDVPLLFETGGDRDVDKTLLISAPPALQRARALARPGMTEERLALILARQMPDEEKRRRADLVIENTGSLADLNNSLLAALESWGILP